MIHAIETKGLCKRYGRVTAVDDLSLRVEPGEIYAFLGLNGAGKTTTIRLLLGMVKPSRGEAHILGMRVSAGANKLWRSVGYLVETATAYPQLTVRENLEAVRRLRPGTLPAAVGQVIARLGLAEYADRPAGTLSLGNAQRLGLAKALIHNPPILLLDEPANGLDPAGIVEIRNLLIGLAHQQGVCVFVSSHLLGEVARMADRIGIIHHGRLIQELDVAELSRNRRSRLLVHTRQPLAAWSALNQAGIPASLGDGDLIEIRQPAALDHPDEIAVCLVQAGHPPLDLHLEQEDLEAYFLRLVGAEQEAGHE